MDAIFLQKFIPPGVKRTLMKSKKYGTPKTGVSPDERNA
jgi:hypothetical protein